ncbi:MAG: dependent oxidoreductase [Clostridia bacterium]|jgi:glycine/D-amino acid oxidase-like deaminating enzyme/nitrite reductase/ring-hydroxylating ferredoxin subunit|nr:dependent oxidoreductase [Clostridia bacterium]
MSLDEFKSFINPPQSYWMASTPTTDYPKLTEDIKVDVAIVGGGMSGISCAYMLAKEGVKVAILEADRILQGTTGHTTAKITSQHGLIYNKIKNKMSMEFAKQYADANESAIRLIEKIQNELHIDCDFIQQPSYVFTRQDQYIQEIKDEVEAASKLGIKASYIEEIPFDIPIKAAVRFENQAQFHPRKYLLTLAQEIIKNEGSIYEQTRAIDIEENGAYVITTKDGKNITAEKVIIASHYPFYNKHGMYFARIYIERSYVLAVKAKEKYPGGMYITAEDPAKSLRSQTSDDGELIILGGEHHKTGQGKDTTNHYEALVAFAKDHFTVEDIPYRWSTQDCMTLDDVPYIGHYTADTPNLYIATGYGKWGMTNSTVSAMILSDLIVRGRSPYQDVYNPSRKTIAASAKEFIKENVNVAKELIKGKFSPLPDDFEIKPGEGKVINGNGERMGAFRDEQGVLHLVNTTCTHMGCELQWNSAERSWDCPCHGSRFTYEGNIIEGPAVMPLEYNRDVNTFEKLIKDDF